MRRIIPEVRFWARVRKTSACWEWTGAILDTGYGQFGVGEGKRQSTHRYSWQLHNGAIPAGQSVLHRCDNRACVRPDHLFLGTQLDNMRDMIAKGRKVTNSWLARKTHCKYGHEFTPVNTFLGRKDGKPTRICRQCRTERQRDRRKARKEAA